LQSAIVEEKAVRASPGNKTSKSSVSGIPSTFPKLPKFPYSAFANQDSGMDAPNKQPVVMKSAPEIPKFVEKPEIPEGKRIQSILTAET